MSRLSKKAQTENLYLTNGYTAYRTEPLGEKAGGGYLAFIKQKDGEAPISPQIDRLSKMLIEEEGWEITREQYYSHISPQGIF